MPSRASTILFRLVVGTLTATLLTASLVGAAGNQARADTAPADPNDPKTPVTVSNDLLPTPQIDGVAWASAMANDTVYIAGSFGSARPYGAAPGQNTVPRTNLMSFDVSSGQLLPFSPSVNGQILAVAVSPDRSRLYIGGEFTSVAGQARSRVAAFNTANGALIGTFAPAVGGSVRSLSATNSTVYVGGNFSSVGNVRRAFLAAFTTTGQLLDWAPQATGGGGVAAVLVNPQGTKVAVGGSFTALNGSNNPGYGLGMVDAVTGASLPMAVNSIVRNGTTDGAIDAFTTDGTYVYGSGWTFGRSGGTLEGVFAASWDGGEVRFINDCHGDTYDVEVIGKVLYTAGHTHYCENLDGVRQGAGGVGDYPYYRAIAMTTEPTRTLTWEPDQGRYYNFAGQPAPEMLGWYPSFNAGSYTGQFQGPWTVTGTSDYVVLAGEFTRINNRNQQGISRFTIRERAPNLSGPKLSNTTYPLNVTSTEAGSVRINWMANNDDDNENLTYRVYRDSQIVANLRHSVTQRFRRWDTVTMGFTDTGLAPGSSHQYRVAVTDPFGNTANSPWTPVTVASSGSDSAYVKAVYASQPTNYWRLGEPSGVALSADRVGFMPSTAQAGVTRGLPGAISGDNDTSSAFSGTNTGWQTTLVQHSPPDVFSIEAWFNTTSVTGGRILGWSNRSDRNSQKHDRQLYLDNLGRIHFGARPTNQRLVASSTSAYNDGAWHHVVGTLSNEGLKLYVDGAQVGANPDVVTAEHLSLGYWRIGGDTVNGWPSAPLSGFFTGRIDEVAVYKHALTAPEIAAHYAAGSGAPTPNVSPVAAFSTHAEQLKVTVDATDSRDPDGTVTDYRWTFGDGATGSGVTASHDYQQAGTYPVTLTVTDDDGATHSLTRQVGVTVPPTAAFTETVNGLSVDFDGTGSNDPDGTIAGYHWAFGDGTTGSGATTSHDYQSSGNYAVTLTVTDDDGASRAVTRQISVTAAGTPFAADAFSRTVTNGWGNADIGGAWVRTGSASNFAVGNGRGTLRIGSAGSGPAVALTGATSSDTELRMTIGVDKAATGGGIYVTARPRMTAGGSYRADARYLANGTVSLILARTAGGSDTTLLTQAVAGLTVVPGDRLNLKVQGFGSSPTTLRAKIWAVGTAEPTGWTGSVTDSTAALQAPGWIGLSTYLSGSATNAPVSTSFDDLWAGARP